MIKAMEQYRQFPAMGISPARQKWMPMLIYAAIFLIATASAVLIFLTITGYGTLQIEGLPAGAVVRLNGNPVPAAPIKLRPGNYQIGIWSPTTAPYEDTAHIGVFRRTVYRPKFDQRNGNAIAGSVLGAVPNTSQTPQFQQSQWFENGSWLAGSFTPSNIVATFQYDNHAQQWTLVYCSDESCPHDQSKLPEAVAAYIQTLMAANTPEKVAE